MITSCKHILRFYKNQFICSRPALLNFSHKLSISCFFISPFIVNNHKCLQLFLFGMVLLFFYINRFFVGLLLGQKSSVASRHCKIRERVKAVACYLKNKATHIVFASNFPRSIETKRIFKFFVFNFF